MTNNNLASALAQVENLDVSIPQKSFSDLGMDFENYLEPQPSLFEKLIPTESPHYLQSQLITYIGNKRALLGFIGNGFNFARRELGKDKISILDLFSGTGVISRMAKQYASHIIANDLELYSRITNQCYLSNKSEMPWQEIRETLAHVQRQIQENWNPGFIAELYAPAQEDVITNKDRVFYTKRNAIYLDTASRVIADLPPEIRKYILAPLLAQASVHVNTSGVFKGFYKNKEGIGQFGGTAENALSRILKDIHLTLPITSNFHCPFDVCQGDANQVIRDIPKVDVAYFDPPYNQHPYGSNYFMLNLICDYKKPQECSPKSGIPNNWNRSAYNKRGEASRALFDAVENCKADFVLISYNSEGFISYDNFISELERIGSLSVLDTEYNTFRGCRNLRARDTHVTEFLYLVDKR